jgi:hypothetical protein
MLPPRGALTIVPSTFSFNSSFFLVDVSLLPIIFGLSVLEYLTK